MRVRAASHYRSHNQIAVITYSLGNQGKASVLRLGNQMWDGKARAEENPFQHWQWDHFQRQEWQKKAPISRFCYDLCFLVLISDLYCPSFLENWWPIQYPFKLSSSICVKIIFFGKDKNSWEYICLCTHLYSRSYVYLYIQKHF